MKKSRVALIAFIAYSFYFPVITQARQEIIPRRVFIAIENSSNTNWCLHIANSFAMRVIDDIPLGSAVHLYEFASEVTPLGYTDCLTRELIEPLKDRLPRKLSRDSYVNYKGLADVLQARSDHPAAVIVITSGKPCPPPRHPFIDPVSALASVFPDTGAHFVALAGLSDDIFSTVRPPSHISRIRIDTRTGNLPRLHPNVFYTHLEVPEPTPAHIPTSPPTSTRIPNIPTPTSTKTRTPSSTPLPPLASNTPTSSPTPTETAASSPVRDTPQVVLVPTQEQRKRPRSMPSPTRTPCPTKSPQPSTTPTFTPEPSLIPIINKSPWVPGSIGADQSGGKPSSFVPHGLWLWILGIAGLLLFCIYQWLIRQDVKSQLPGLHGEDAVGVMELSVEGPEGTVVEPEEHAVESHPEVVVIGESPRSNLYVPEIRPPVKIRLMPHGALQRHQGWRWREVFPGETVSLGNGLSLVWSFRWIKRDDLRKAGVPS